MPINLNFLYSSEIADCIHRSQLSHMTPISRERSSTHTADTRASGSWSQHSSMVSFIDRIACSKEIQIVIIPSTQNTFKLKLMFMLHNSTLFRLTHAFHAFQNDSCFHAFQNDSYFSG